MDGRTVHLFGGEGKLEKHNQEHQKLFASARPILQRLCPPISMGRAAVPPTDGAADPYGPAQGARGWFWRRDGWFACLGR